MLVSQPYVWSFLGGALVMVIGGLIDRYNQRETQFNWAVGSASTILIGACLISFMAGPSFNGEVTSVSKETAVVAVEDFPLAVSDGGLPLEKGDKVTVRKLEKEWKVVKVTKEAR